MYAVSDVAVVAKEWLVLSVGQVDAKSTFCVLTNCYGFLVFLVCVFFLLGEVVRVKSVYYF